MFDYKELLGHPLFDSQKDYLAYPDPDDIRLAYERARLICQKSGLTVQDIVRTTPKFWDFYREPILARDTTIGVILPIHWNLCIGTIGSYAPKRPDLIPLLEKLMRFELCGEFMLTEIGHGLDARNLETTATLQADGSFDLDSPIPTAAKAMPPSTPWAGVGRVGVVFARLISAEGEDLGVKPFIVHINDEKGNMCKGVTCRALPTRSGSRAVDHALTTFTHVRLEPGALLGSPQKAADQRADFFKQIYRVPIGTLSLSLTNIPLLRQCAYIAGTYSLRRRVAAGGGEGNGLAESRQGATVPIIRFATQYRPILDTLVQSRVYGAFSHEAVAMFQDSKLHPLVRHAVAVCFKATVTMDTQAALAELTDRCGWQGLFGYNQIIENAMALRGNSIAEGDYTVLCIRLVSEVLRGRYEIPKAKMKDCLLAKHEAGVWEEARAMVASLKDQDFRGEEFNALILPRCRDIVRATGHRMAYEAAAAVAATPGDGANAGITPEALSLFECICMKTDLSWYVSSSSSSSQSMSRSESGSDIINRAAFFARDALAGKEALPELETFLTQSREDYLPRVPIMYEETWAEFIQGLPKFEAGQIATEAQPQPQTQTQTEMDVEKQADGRGSSMAPIKISLRVKSSAGRRSVGVVEKPETSSIWKF
ncbi:acyl-CoA dehydrogenase/oxidase [Xylariaceae sp. FL0594]|nr:acyl-CoA dehydrogenase/oxidase [Xylariaceae sp. FL0594]